MTKQEARVRMKQLRAGLAEPERLWQEQQIRERLFADGIWEKIEWFYPYVSHGTEVDTVQLIRRVLDAPVAGHRVRVAVPRVEGRNMEFYEITSMEQLSPGSYGIMEPVSGCPWVSAGRGLMLVPGLAFDGRGYRVGYGGGYYDRYLAGHAGAELSVYAVAYDFQLVDVLEAQEFDIRVHRVITSQLPHNLNKVSSNSNHKGNIIPC